MTNAPLPGLVATLRSHADDCENMERWATPELAPLLRRAADVIEQNGELTGQPQCAREALQELIEAARQMPRQTPGPGGAATLHHFELSGGAVWGLDRALEKSLAALSGKPGAAPQSPADALRLLAELFSESLHQTWTRGEIVNVIEDAIRLGARPDEWEALRGAAPNATGDLSSEQFIRQHRDEWDGPDVPRPESKTP